MSVLRRLALLAVAAALVASGCRRASQAEKRANPLFEKTLGSGVKVLLVGIDGGTFDLIDPLAAEGRLSNFKKLMDAGTHARLRSQEPILSPAVWTTIATGHDRQTHGIYDFVSKDRGDAQHPALVSSASRRTLALWNVVGPFKKDVGVVGWWVTWPAEPVRGYLVSDRVAHSRWQSWTEGWTDRSLTSPPGLFEEIKTLIVDPLAPPMSEIEQLVSMDTDEKNEFLAARSPILFHGPSVFKFGYCEQRTYEKIALHMLERGSQPDLMMVFLIATDPISHTYWHYYQPQQFSPGPYRQKADRLGKLVPNIYLHNDGYLRELLGRIDKNTVVMVVSDHGFQASGQLPGQTSKVDYRVVGIPKTTELDRPVNVGMSGIHHIEGIFIAAGGPIVRGAVFRTPPSVRDITPTVLALMGLPVAGDMPGRVLDEIIDPSFLAAHPVQRISSYEDYIDRDELRAAAQGDDQQRLQYLRSLGYID